MDLSELTHVSLRRYLNTISLIGEVSNKDTEKILILTFIEEFLSDPTIIYYINEKDDKIIDRALNCLYNSNCYIEFPKCNNGNAFNIISEEGPSPRITENNIIRSSEDNLYRYTERN